MGIDVISKIAKWVLTLYKHIAGLCIYHRVFHRPELHGNILDWRLRRSHLSFVFYLLSVLLPPSLQFRNFVLSLVLLVELVEFVRPSFVCYRSFVELFLFLYKVCLILLEHGVNSP